MTKPNEIYKCSICGNMVEMIETWIWTLVCCGKNMDLQSDEIKAEWQEKHIPVIEKTTDWILIKVWSNPHPMTAEHYIQWIQIITPTQTYKKFLSPDSIPQAIFHIQDEEFEVRAYCNIHWLWKNNFQS